MIIASVFPGDNNLAAMRIQHDLYWGLVGYLFALAKERYLGAVRPIGVPDELSESIRDKVSFDHRVLQHAHDHIAAYFRLTHPDLMQLDMLDDTKGSEDDIAKQWTDYFIHESRVLAEDDHIAKAILKAVALQNTETGQDFEGVLVNYLRDRYPLPESD